MDETKTGEQLNDLQRWETLEGIEASHSSFYDEIYKKTELNAPQEVNFLIKALNHAPPARVLDLGCGFGRHCIELAKRGFRTTGVDISDDLLNIARRKAKEAAINVEFVRDDIRRVDFGKTKFDSAIMMLNAFGLMTDADNEKVIQQISKSLRTQGKVFMDLRNPERLKEGTLYENPEKIDGLEVWTKVSYYSSLKRVHIFRYLDQHDKQAEYHFIARLYSPQELTELFGRNGLKVLNFYGSFDGELYDPKTSPRLIVIGEKL